MDVIATMSGRTHTAMEDLEQDRLTMQQLEAEGRLKA
jgi:hypothetical protein